MEWNGSLCVPCIQELARAQREEAIEARKMLVQARMEAADMQEELDKDLTDTEELVGVVMGFGK